jgi:hypothetical protein
MEEEEEEEDRFFSPSMWAQPHRYRFCIKKLPTPAGLPHIHTGISLCNSVLGSK